MADSSNIRAESAANSIDLNTPARGDEIARNALWRVVEVAGSELLAFGFMVFLARLLLPEDYGVVAIASVFLMLAQMIVYHGFAEAIIQKADLREADSASALWLNIAIGLGLAGLLAILAFPMASWLEKPLLGPILAGLAPITIFFGITGIYQARVRRQLRLKILALRTLVSVIAGGSVGLIMAFSGMGAWSLVGQQLAYAISGVIVLIVATGWLPKPILDLQRVKAMANFGWHVMLTFLIDVLSRNITTIILGYFLAAELVGEFFIANRLFFSAAMLTFMSVNELCLPILARLQDKQAEHYDGVHKCFRLTALICLPVYMGLAAIAEPVILALFGEKWSGAIDPLVLLCLFGICHAFASLASQVFLSLNHPKRASELTLVTCGLLVILVIPAASFGLIFATFAMGIAYLLVLPFAVWRLVHVMDIDFGRLFRDQLPIWLSALAMISVIFGLQQLGLEELQPLWRLICTIPLAALVFGLCLRVLAPEFVIEVASSLRAGLGIQNVKSL